MNGDELLIIIQELLQKGVEGGYWDFKSQYPAIAEDKLHDIICMANNLENRDAYLIYGANDDGSICGIESSQTRLAAITGSIAEAAYGIPDWMKDKAISYLDEPLRDVLRRWKKFYEPRRRSYYHL